MLERVKDAKKKVEKEGKEGMLREISNRSTALFHKLAEKEKVLEE